MPRDYTFYIYIVTNPRKTVLYVGFTNNLTQRLLQHTNDRGSRQSFAAKYYCYKLVYYEVFQYVDQAIAREKEIKKWSRKKKEALIASTNPNWNFLNREFISRGDKI